MNIHSFLYQIGSGWEPDINDPNLNVNLVLTFGDQVIMFDQGGYDTLRKAFPNAEIVGCSSAAEIHGNDVYENALTVTAIEFASSHISVVKRVVHEELDSHKTGKDLAHELMQQDKLKHVFVLSEAIKVNGVSLVDGFNETLPSGVITTGALACSNRELNDTRVWHNDSGAIHQVLAIGFYGDNIELSYGSFAGWQPFGPQRKLTRVEGKIVYEFDGQPALDLYKKYLGEEAKNLPKSAMKFPILVTDKLGDEHGIARCIQSIDEENKSLIFADDVKQDKYATLMYTDVDTLVHAGFEAGKLANQMQHSELAILVSCLGRKVVMEHRTAEEVEDACESLEKSCTITGFYSFGEICPAHGCTESALQHQTMTVTTLKERI